MLFDKSECFACTLVCVPSPHDEGWLVVLESPRFGGPRAGSCVREGGCRKFALKQFESSSYVVVGVGDFLDGVLDVAVSVCHCPQQLCGVLDVLVHVLF